MSAVLRGQLIMFDKHWNLLLSNVQEIRQRKITATAATGEVTFEIFYSILVLYDFVSFIPLLIPFLPPSVSRTHVPHQPCHRKTSCYDLV